MGIGTKIRASLGEIEADILFTNARIINVFSGEIIPGDIAVTGGFISEFGSYPAENGVINDEIKKPEPIPVAYSMNGGIGYMKRHCKNCSY